jgi:DNA replication protein
VGGVRPDGRPEVFPRGVHLTPVPSPLLGPLLADIDDIGELKCTLRAAALLHLTDRKPKWITENELLADEFLVLSLGSRAAVGDALELAVQRGTLLRVGTANRRLALNTADGRVAMQQAVNEGHATQEPLATAPTAAHGAAAPRTAALGAATREANIFSLYEDNVGALSPMIVDELKQAEDDYPADWIAEAFREAVVANARSWRYVRAILERWTTEGRGDRGSKSERSARGRSRGHIKEARPGADSRY